MDFRHEFSWPANVVGLLRATSEDFEMSELSDITPTGEWNALYWSYNCPLQMWNEEDGWRVVNYMPRKECCIDLEQRVTQEELPQFCKNAAARLRNLALLFEALGEGKIDYIYYPDKSVDDAIAEKKQNESEGN